MGNQQKINSKLYLAIEDDYDIKQYPYLIHRRTGQLATLFHISANSKYQINKIREYIYKYSQTICNAIPKFKQFYHKSSQIYCQDKQDFYLLFCDHGKYTLKDQYNNRIFQQYKFKQNEILSILQTLLCGLKVFYDQFNKNIACSMQSICIETLTQRLYLKDSWLKINDVMQSSYVNQILTYPSPQKLYSLYIAKQIVYDQFQSNLFSIGMICLQIYYMKKINEVYNKNKTINMMMLYQYVQAIKNQKLKQILNILLNDNPIKRSQIYKVLKLNFASIRRLQCQKAMSAKSLESKSNVISNQYQFLTNNFRQISDINHNHKKKSVFFNKTAQIVTQKSISISNNGPMEYNNIVKCNNSNQILKSNISTKSGSPTHTTSINKSTKLNFIAPNNYKNLTQSVHSFGKIPKQMKITQIPNKFEYHSIPLNKIANKQLPQVSIFKPHKINKSQNQLQQDNCNKRDNKDKFLSITINQLSKTKSSQSIEMNINIASKQIQQSNNSLIPLIKNFQPNHAQSQISSSYQNKQQEKYINLASKLDQIDLNEKIINSPIYQCNSLQTKQQIGDFNIQFRYKKQQFEETRTTQPHLIKCNSTIQEVNEQSPISSQNSIGLQNQKPQFVIQTYQTGSKYEGYKSDGMRNGKGKFYYQDSGHYEGQWKKNKMHGWGILYYNCGKIAYEGYWKNDEFHGFGKVYNDNPVIKNTPFDYTNFDLLNDYWVYYQGALVSDTKEGRGRIVLTNGQLFQGDFHLDKLQGFGKFMTMDKKFIEGIWRDSKLVKIISSS